MRGRSCSQDCLQENDRDRKTSFLRTSLLAGRRLCGKELPFISLLFASVVRSIYLAAFPLPCYLTQTFRTHVSAMPFLKAFLPKLPSPPDSTLVSNSAGVQ